MVRRRGRSIAAAVAVALVVVCAPAVGRWHWPRPPRATSSTSVCRRICGASSTWRSRSTTCKDPAAKTARKMWTGTAKPFKLEVASEQGLRRAARAVRRLAGGHLLDRHGPRRAGHVRDPRREVQLGPRGRTRPAGSSAAPGAAGRTGAPAGPVREVPRPQPHRGAAHRGRHRGPAQGGEDPGELRRRASTRSRGPRPTSRRRSEVALDGVYIVPCP